MTRKVTCRCAGERSSILAVAGPCDHMMRRTPLRLTVLLLLGLALVRPSLAVEGGLRQSTGSFEVIPKWVRPGPSAIVTVKLCKKIDTSKRMFLRLTEEMHTIKDMPLDSEQLRRGIAEVKVLDPIRRGTYKTELVNDDGQVQASGPDLKVGISEKPSISAILPSVNFKSKGTFNFDVIGENFSDYYKANIIVRVNDVPIRFKGEPLWDRSGEMTAENCKELPCLIWNWRTLRVFGYSPKDYALNRPLKVTVEVEKLVSDPKILVLSRVQPSVPRLIAGFVLLVLGILVYFISPGKAKLYQVNGRTYPTFTYLLIDPQTNTYSLSKFQLILWTAAVVMAYAYLAASQFLVQGMWMLPKVPEGLPMLLGISATTTAVAVGATEFRGSKGAGPVHPGLGDFITTGGVFAPERLQFFLWTILGTFAFVCATLSQDPATVSQMADIPQNFSPLMGASSLGYLAGKFARKPGPVIKQLIPPPPYSLPESGPPGSIRIIGENLSPRAQVYLNGAPLQTGQIVPVPEEKKDAEFVMELIVNPKMIASAPSGVAPLKVINPDGQSAEMD